MRLFVPSDGSLKWVFAFLAALIIPTVLVGSRKPDGIPEVVHAVIIGSIVGVMVLVTAERLLWGGRE